MFTAVQAAQKFNEIIFFHLCLFTAVQAAQKDKVLEKQLLFPFTAVQAAQKLSGGTCVNGHLN